MKNNDEYEKITRMWEYELELLKNQKPKKGNNNNNNSRTEIKKRMNKTKKDSII